MTLFSLALYPHYADNSRDKYIQISFTFSLEDQKLVVTPVSFANDKFIVSLKIFI